MSRAVVVMGVSGCGKSSVAAALAQQLGWHMVDADDLHSPTSVAKMRAGEALTDADRGPWLDRVGAVLAEASAQGLGVLVACSALRRSYRDRLRAACPGMRFLFLDGSRDVIADRMSRRPGHYMPASLLDSQWKTLERPGEDEADVYRIDVDPGLDDVLRQAQAALSSGHRSPPKTPWGACDMSMEMALSDTPRQQQRVAIVGAGIMGSAIARRLIDCGHALAVFDLDPAKLEPLQALGARVATSACDAAREADFVITSLNSAAIVRAAVFGSAGVVEGLASRAKLIDMSSIDPSSTRALGDDLRQRCGAGWVDAPLSGGAPKALTGRLTVMAGGSPADVARAEVLMRDLCANFTHMGPLGAGQTTKLVNQLLCAIGFQAVAEAVRLAEAGGVDATRLGQALSGGRADSAILQEFGPKMAVRDETPTGRIDNMLKDLEAVQAYSQQQRLPLPLTAQVAELHRALVAADMGGLDTVAMMRQFNGFRPS